MQNKNVLEVIAERYICNQLGLPKPDNYRLGLAVEGGGMRGVVSCGMLLALRDLRLLDLFDNYSGVSAGALNLAYVLAGQGPLGLSVYLDDMTDPANLNLHRVRDHDHPVMDMRAVYRNITEHKPLRTAALRNRYARDLHVAVSNVSQGNGELTSLNEAGSDFQKYLVAGATIPIVAGDAWRINGQNYFDGGLYYIDPIQCARQLDCSHVLVLNTTFEGYMPKPYSWLVSHFIEHLDSRYNGAGSRYLELLNAWCQTAALLPWGEVELNGMQAYRLAPKRDTHVGRVTTDVDRLIHGMRTGYQSVLDIFSPATKVGLVPTAMR